MGEISLLKGLKTHWMTRIFVTTKEGGNVGTMHALYLWSK